MVSSSRWPQRAQSATAKLLFASPLTLNMTILCSHDDGHDGAGLP